MANELNLRLDPVLQAGLDVTARVRQRDGSQVGSDVTLSEPQTAYYTGDFNTSSMVDGEYPVEFIDDNSGRLLGTGVLNVKGGAEYNLPDIPNATENADAVWSKTLP